MAPIPRSDPPTPPHPTLIDPRVPRFNQGATGVLLLLAFALDLKVLVPVLGLILGLGALFGTRANLWAQVFLHVVKPLFRLGPPTSRKDAAPTRFAMTLGAVFLAGATAALYLLSGAPAAWIGWTAALVVAALALLAAITDLCVGCEIYAYAARLRQRQTEPPVET